MDETMKAAIQAVRDAELAKRSAPADEAAPTPGDAMDPAVGATLSTSEPSQGGGLGEMLSGLGDSMGNIADAAGETLGRIWSGEADPEFAKAVTGAETQLDNTVTDPSRQPDLHEKAVATMAAIPTGAVRAGYEAVDGAKSLVGIDPSPQSPERSRVESLDQSLRDRTMAAGLASSLSSFAVGLIGAGKLLGPLKGLGEGSRVATAAYETAKGAAAGFFALGPHEGRLSDMVQQFPSLENPVTAYLASDPQDSQVEGRLKNALEGIGMDVAVAAVFAGGLKVMRALRSGDKEAAKVASLELENATQEVETVPPLNPIAPEVPQVTQLVEKPRVRVKAGSAQVTPEAPLVSMDASEAGPATPTAVTLPMTSPAALTSVDGSLEAILSGTKADLKAIDEAGGLSAAMDAGYRLDATQAFPWKRIVTGDDVDVLVENSLRQAAPALSAMRGGDVLKDVAVTAAIKDIAKTYQQDPQLLIGELSQAGDAAVDSVRRMEAGHLMFRKMSLDVTSAVKKFNAGQFAEFGGEEAARTEIKRRLALMLEVYGHTQAIVSNAGRVVRRQRTERGGSVCLNSFWRFAKWFSASIMPLPSSVSAR